MLKKIFGVKGSGGSSSGGGSSGGGSTNTKEQKKEAEELDKELEKQKEELEKLMQLADGNNEVDQIPPPPNYKKKKFVKFKGTQKKKVPTSGGNVTIDDIRAELDEQIAAIMQNTNVVDTFSMAICPITRSLVDKLVQYLYDRPATSMDYIKDPTIQFDSIIHIIEKDLLRRAAEEIGDVMVDMMEDMYESPITRAQTSIGDSFDENNGVRSILAWYNLAAMGAVRTVPVGDIFKQNMLAEDYRRITKAIIFSANEELVIDFQAELDKIAKTLMAQIKENDTYQADNPDKYSAETVSSHVARIQMRCIADLAQILGEMGIVNKKVRNRQITAIKNLVNVLHQVWDLQFKKIDADYLTKEAESRNW
jgi:hypothetical protein